MCVRVRACVRVRVPDAAGAWARTRRAGRRRALGRAAGGGRPGALVLDERYNLSRSVSFITHTAGGGRPGALVPQALSLRQWCIKRVAV